MSIFTKVKWQYLDKVGMPGPEIVNHERGYPRQFLLLSSSNEITCSFTNDRGTDFLESMHEPVVAWAVIEGL
jgi:hypothetical protein